MSKIFHLILPCCGIWSFDYFPEMTSEIFLELLGMQKSTIFFITETPNDQMFLQSIQGEYFLRFDRLPSVGNCYNQSTKLIEWNISLRNMGMKSTSSPYPTGNIAETFIDIPFIPFDASSGRLLLKANGKKITFWSLLIAMNVHFNFANF